MKGTFASNEGQLTCSACPAGKYIGSDNKSSCTACLKGQYQVQACASLTVSKECPISSTNLPSQIRTSHAHTYAHLLEACTSRHSTLPRSTSQSPYDHSLSLRTRKAPLSVSRAQRVNSPATTARSNVCSVPPAPTQTVRQRT